MKLVQLRGSSHMNQKNGEGPLDLAVLDNGMVVIQFRERIKQVTFTPEQAKSLGVGLIEMGTRAESLQRAVGKTAIGPRRAQ